ncbi:MAG: XRE family transcriptional regulator [Marinibacterium sp.]|nr:XRE family transcriptional regulator [Marinibacterium sp.]
MTEQTDTILTQLPGKLKEARRAQGLSLDAVAKLSGVSRSMVSQIERGESSPTIATLLNLTRALQVDFAGLLDDNAPEPRIEVLRSGQHPVIDKLGTACRILILSPPEEVGTHEVYQLEFRAGGRLDSAPHQRGAREQLTVLDGQISVTAGTDTIALCPGDTARYAADQPHAIVADSDSARAFLIVRDG